MASKQLTEKRNLLDEKRELLKKVFDEAKTSDPDVMDYEKVKSIEGTTVAKAEKIRLMNEEINDLSDEVKKLAAADEAAVQLKNAMQVDAQTTKQNIIHPGSKDGSQPEMKALGEHFTGLKSFQEWLQRKQGDFHAHLNIFPSQLKWQLKTLFQTSAGWAPESTRTGIVVDYATRPIQVTDLIPAARTNQAAVVYMEETTRTDNSAEKAEGGTYAESQFALTEQSETVRKVTNSIPVTDEQLEDVDMVESYLGNRLNFGIRQRVDYQAIQGNGTAPNLLGVMNKSGIQTQAKGADPVPDAIFKAMTKVKVTGRAQPNAVILHPNDWQDLRLLRTTDGIYIWGNPAEAVAPRIWGLPVAESDIATENTGIVGDFANYSMIFERRGIDMQVGYSGTQFVEGKRTMRADMRLVIVWFRAAAFCTVTGI